MQRTTTAASPSVAIISSAHRARVIKDPPNPDTAADLLKELATARCAFSPVLPGAPLALYGAGNMGRLARDFLATVDHEPVMVIDRDAQRLAQDPYWSGVKLQRPDETADIAKDGLCVAVSVVTSPYVPIERSLQRLGFKDVVPFYDVAECFRDVHPLSNGWFAQPLTALDQVKTVEVLARWDDDVSRAHHLQFLAWRRLREEWDFVSAPLPECTRFFIPEVTSVLGSDEFLLDAGAHHGSVLQAFIARANAAFRGIAAIEPDPSNRVRLEANVQAWLPDDARVTIYDCALADNEGSAAFS